MRGFFATRPLLVPLLLGLGWFAIVHAAGEHDFWLPLGVYAGLISIGALWVYGRWMERLLRARRRDALRGALGGLALAVASWVLYPPIAEAFPFVADDVRRLYGIVHGPIGAAEAAPLAVLIILGEEMLWRGVFLEALRLRMRSGPAILLAAVAYAATVSAHGSVVLVGLALAWGVVWGAQRVHSDSLVVPILSHLIWASAVVAIAPLEA
ncbi:MAG: CPBP family intramembrane glutamic endopeptidase [Myxococcota bacterium]